MISKFIHTKAICKISILIFGLAYPNFLQGQQAEDALDILSYHVFLEPNMEQRSVEGSVTINFLIDPNAQEIVLSSGNLHIDKIIGESVTEFRQGENQVSIDLAKRDKVENKLTIYFSGNPSRGLLFDPELSQAYTVYFTSDWMVCNDSPGDKAKISLDLLIPSDLDCIANGELVGKSQQENKMLYSWNQDYETPAYTYGFAIGEFSKTSETFESVLLNYYSRKYSSDQLMAIFRETPAMMSFFEEKSGVKYYQSAYSQILMGNHYQEMSGFSVLKNSYGELVLKDSTETNLISHELAHQWWGNRITCKSWNHFWLNEGFATFLSAAYNEHRFGEEKYNSDINSYYKVYKEIKDLGHDKSLVFDDWTNPTKDDRNLVYFKGAYVLHLLRIEMGEEAFWQGIKSYSIKYFGKSVETIDFQSAMEESFGRSLTEFFNTWVYFK